MRLRDNYIKRSSGILMPLFSLPSPYGIGTLGKKAYEFVDFLKATNQTYWQMLPVCPTSFGDSPYQSFSTFAGNPYFIDLDTLSEQGYLKSEDYRNMNWGQDETKVDYALLYIERNKVFEKLYKNFAMNIPEDFYAFCEENAYWLEDFALFMAIKDSFGGVKYTEWDEDIRKREETTLTYYREKCKERTVLYKMLQYFFFKQWFSLKNYANQSGIQIIGDLPIYVAEDSADVWSNPKCFKLDEYLKPTEVAGCPPDAFSEDGQLWGNPVYDWHYMEATGYEWWINRLKMSLKIYDVIRIDHFRAFESYYCIKYGEKTARNGQWRKGPDIFFWEYIKKQMGGLPIIAEDLGFLTPDVHKMLEKSGFPGMKVLQFAFDSRDSNNYLPHLFQQNCVVYTGTHDNDTINGWLESVNHDDLEFAKKYLHTTSDDIREEIIISAMSSVANICILTIQDLIGLGSEGRINTPSTLGGNWMWRLKSDAITESIQKTLSFYTSIYERKRLV